MSREKLLTDTVKFCKYHLGKDCFAPFTGQDYPAFFAFVYLVQCFAHGGGQSALDAMRATVLCAQRTKPVLSVFVQAVPAVMDWGDVARLWPAIVDELVLRDTSTFARLLWAVERSEHFRGDSKHVEESRTAWGWRPTPIAQGAAR